MSNTRYYLEKYNKEYKCNYKYKEFTYNWDTIGERDRYKCPECYYVGDQDLCHCGGDTIYDLY